MITWRRAGTSHTLFEVGVFARGIQALFQFTVAIVIYRISDRTLLTIADRITAHELNKDPHDLVANFLLHHAHHITKAGQEYAALFFFVSSVINIILVAGLLTKRRIMYPIAEYLIAAFSLYQMYLFTNTLSLWLIAFTIYDGALIWLIHLEYRRRWPLE